MLGMFNWYTLHNSVESSRCEYILVAATIESRCAVLLLDPPSTKTRGVYEIRSRILLARIRQLKRLHQTSRCRVRICCSQRERPPKHKRSTLRMSQGLTSFRAGQTSQKFDWIHRYWDKHDLLSHSWSDNFPLRSLSLFPGLKPRILKQCWWLVRKKITSSRNRLDHSRPCEIET